MFDDIVRSWTDWWASVPADFVFLLSLPVMVAALGLIADGLQRRRRRSP